MSITEIKSMSREEQLQTMELLWDELCHRKQALASPEWHKGILDERQSMIAEGSARYLTIDEVKKQNQP